MLYFSPCLVYGYSMYVCVYELFLNMCGCVYSCACCGSQSWDQGSGSIALPRRQASQSNRTEEVSNLGMVLGIPSLPSEAGTPGIAMCHENTHSGPQAGGNPFNY